MLVQVFASSPLSCVDVGPLARVRRDGAGCGPEGHNRDAAAVYLSNVPGVTSARDLHFSDRECSRSSADGLCGPRQRRVGDRFSAVWHGLHERFSIDQTAIQLRKIAPLIRACAGRSSAAKQNRNAGDRFYMPVCLFRTVLASASTLTNPRAGNGNEIVLAIGEGL